MEYSGVDGHKYREYIFICQIPLMWSMECFDLHIIPSSGNTLQFIRLTNLFLSHRNTNVFKYQTGQGFRDVGITAWFHGQLKLRLRTDWMEHCGQRALDLLLGTPHYSSVLPPC